MSSVNNIKGFTLVELMVALAAGSFLLAGVSLSYSAIKGTINVSKELENAQEVIRYTSKVFTRSIKQTIELPTVAADGLSISIVQPSGVLMCTGEVSTAQATEVYSINDNNMQCAIDGAAPERLLTGVQSLTFSINNDVVTINVKPEHLPSQFGSSVAIDVAVSNVILNRLVGGT